MRKTTALFFTMATAMSSACFAADNSNGNALSRSAIDGADRSYKTMMFSDFIVQNGNSDEASRVRDFASQYTSLDRITA